jgi:hypothetical protein
LLIPVAENGGHPMLARVGVMLDLNRHVVQTFNPALKIPLRKVSGVSLRTA